MASIVGEVAVKADGKTWTQRLSLRGLATLQDEYGTDLQQIIGIEAGAIPHFGAILRVIELALKKHHPEATPDDAEAILTADLSVFGRVIEAAFPAAEVNDAPGKRAAAA
jgi:hypothetical protein